MIIKYKKTKKEAIEPTKGTSQAAGYDLYIPNTQTSILIQPHSTFLIDTGISMEIPEGYFGGIFARSGLAARQGLRPSNCVGVIDSDYRDSVKIVLYNDTDQPQSIESGQRIAQLVILPYLTVDFQEVEELTSTDRVGGFGSTGK